MDVFSSLPTSNEHIKCVDMHTSGGPVRIPIQGLPNLTGTLLGQKSQASLPENDYIRRRLLLEPRGHDGMYGGILRKDTELTKSGVADIGILYIHSGGYSMMCGHVTLGVSRFLIDTHDPEVFPNREKLRFDTKSLTTELRLHAPCGLLRITVPTMPDGKSSDPNRDVSFLSVPSFAAGLDIEVPIETIRKWTELGTRSSIVVDISFSGAFFAIVSAQELGFANGVKDIRNLEELWPVVNTIRDTISTAPELSAYTYLPTSPEPVLVNGVIIRDSTIGQTREDVSGAEVGIVFVENAIDRSPCGSGTAARVALAYAKGERKIGERWAYHSMLSLTSDGQGPFVGSPEEEIVIPGGKGVGARGVVVRTEGRAYYTGASIFVLEDIDKISRSGFKIMELSKALAGTRRTQHAQEPGT
ncbi:putative proline racemase [Mollisia scopiformis]|uniref:trans-L-3-hydroxyproline dehydratase n=1 Tax=Mollisia scopiformis TaxID=149040 RepID=A0A194WTP0_MOLSC|nr:putative proline racemase [Mollisia scopiformis]KUJ11323.1 putative proline racemase [Mollisia scopiformis]